MGLYLTYCSGNKKKGGAYPPAELYKSDRIDRFVDECRRKDLDWAILSAEHGLFFPDEKHSSYDTTFRSRDYECRVMRQENLIAKGQSRQHFRKLVQDVRSDIDSMGYGEFHFYALAPQRAKCYLLLLHRAVDGCRNYHKTTDDIKECLRQHGNIQIWRTPEF